MVRGKSCAWSFVWGHKSTECFLIAALFLIAPQLARGANAPTVEIRAAEYEGRAHFRISTPGAVWFYDRAGGGFSRVIDVDEADWIAFRKTPLSRYPDSAGAGFRGLGNLVFGRENPDAGAGHPGFDLCESEIVGPGVIRTVSLSGRWAWTWTFTETTARFEMERVDGARPWWFLYEGPVGGRWSPRTHYWGVDLGGPYRDTPDNGSQRFGNWQWAYFGDVTSPRVFFIAQTVPDELSDTLWYLGSAKGGALDSPDGMIVFGLGRGRGTAPQFRTAGQVIITGFIEQAVLNSQDHALVAARIAGLVKKDLSAGKQEPPQGILREAD